jgi:glycosyltransferase involved in cell wall biosynthesis
MKLRRPLRLCQFCLTVNRGDATSGQAVAMHHAARAIGAESALFALHPGNEDAVPVQLHTAYAPEPRDVIMLHYGGYSALAPWVMRQAAPAFLYYHNITPPHFYTRVGVPWAEGLQLGRDALPGLACLGGLAGSSFNQRELLLAGFRDVRVLPYILDIDAFRRAAETPAARAVVEQYGQPGVTNWLHVGRIVPNKRIEDIVRAFFVYHTRIEPQSRLFLVGPDSGAEPYSQPLRRWVADLGLQDAVTFTGFVEGREQLAGYYRLAGVYVCMSEHEGFCIPLLEAMVHGVPIVAYRSTGVIDTLGDAGVLVDDKNPRVVAQIAALLCHDAAAREFVVAGQFQQAERWSPGRAVDAVHQWLATL